MRNSNEANHSTNQTPSECKHYVGYGIYLYRNANVVLGRGQKACSVFRSGRYCPDYQPKEKKDNG